MMERVTTITEMRDLIKYARRQLAQLFDDEAKFDRAKDGRFVTETLNFADSYLEQALDAARPDAPASEPEAGDGSVYPGNSKSGFVKAMPLEDYEALVAERDALRNQLAAAGAVISSAKNHLQGVVEYIDNPPRRMNATDISMGMWSQAAAGLEDIEAYQAQSTPQPAPEANLRAAVAPFAELWAEWEVAQDLDEGHFIDYIERTCDVELLARNWLALVKAAK